MESVRVQLEGQLEVLETSISALRRGAESLAERSPGGLREAFAHDASPAMLRAEEAVRRLARREPSVEVVLVQLETARREFWSRAEARGRLLGARHLHPAALLTQLEAEPFDPIRVSSPMLYALAVQCLVVAGVAAGTGLHALLVLAVLGLACGALVAHLESKRVLVTSHRLRIDGVFSPLGPTTVVRVCADRWWVDGVMAVELAGGDGQTRCHSLPAFPASLARAIAQTGARVEFRWWRRAGHASNGCARCAAGERGRHEA